MYFKRTSLSIALIAVAANAAGSPLPSDPKACFIEVTSTLAADNFEGRGTGTPGGDAAARTIAEWMDGIGLAAPPAGRLQAFEASIGVNLGKNNQLDGVAPGSNWTPLGYSKSGSFSGGLVFAGYGIKATDLGYDDYAGLDVRGKVVLALRFEPGENDEKSPFEGKRPSRYSDLRAKAIVAREAGAAALLVVSPAQSADEPDKLPPLKSQGPQSDAGIPVIQVTRAQADLWLKTIGGSLAERQAAIDGSYRPASAPITGVSVSGTVDVQPVSAKSQNVIGLLPGSGALAGEYVVLGAHYDHLGHGGPGSFKPDVRAIHNGADDNASGVAGILCAARQLHAAAPVAARRSVLIVAFSAEEIGLGGSGWFVQHPPAAMSDVAAMINLDMVGRLREHTLSILGSDSSKGWLALIESARAGLPGLKINAGGDGYGPSDHSSFYAAGVPVVHLFTGAHEQYHTPEDDVELLNNDGGADVIALTAALAQAASVDARLDYARTAASAPDAGDSRGYGAYFGSVPDYTAMGATTGGVKLSDVRPGSPAELAGVRKGDVIIGMAGVEIQNLYDMTYVLREHKPGDSVEVVVKRGEQTLRLRATLSQRGAEAASGAHTPPPTETAHASFSVGSSAAAGADWAPVAGRAVPELMRKDEPHLADLRRLTFGGDNAEAYWGPDGKTLSFQRTPPGGGCDAQYLFDLDTGAVTLASSGKGRTTCGYLDYPKAGGLIYATTEAAGPNCPAKPDYSQGYVWAIYRDFDIVRRDANGKVSTLLASPGYDAEATQCFQDGRILYTSTRNGDLDLYVANADGSGIRQLTDTAGYDGGAFFTPDCKQIVWRASRPSGQALVDYQSLLQQGLVRPTELEIFVMDADGRNRRQLTHHGVGSFAPYPTPDGRGVIYSSNVGANPREFDLWFVAWDGREQRITSAPGFDGFPMFSPDGKWLVFASNRANQEGQRDTDLYIARWIP